jgi:hypothetical protein
MQNIAITLFESMVIRNYLFSDNCELLSKLASQNKVILISNYKNLKFIEECIETIDKKNISLFVYKSQNIAFLPKICLSILKWTNSSDTILRDIKIEKKNRVLKFIANRVFSRFPLKDSILRLLILKLFRQNKFHHNISSHHEKTSLPKFDVVFITSLSNQSDDLQVALFARRNRIKIIGTMRSWDNLSSHGGLALIPDVFYSHSMFMSQMLSQFHRLNKNITVTLTAPNYRQNFLLGDRSNPKSILEPNTKIGYGCMGEHINPGEKEFLIKLNEIGKLFSSYEFVVIQHPSFPHEMDFQLNSNFSVVQFDYTRVKLDSYYQSLAQLDVLIAGGSSILLDAVFVGIPIAYLNFEIIKQDYWKSALRYYDTLNHTKKFIELVSPRTLNNEEDLINLLSEKKFSSLIINKTKVDFFTGDSFIDLNARLIEIILN